MNALDRGTGEIDIRYLVVFHRIQEAELKV